MKYLKFTIFSIALLFALSAQALEFTVDNLKYITNADSTSVTVKNPVVKPVGELVIPSDVTYNGKEYTVTSIGFGAFDYCISITSITVPESVISIRAGAFNDCMSLASITIPEGIKSIEPRTFYGCSSLVSIVLPESITSIEKEAFMECTSLASIKIPSNVTSIGQEAFNSCKSLSSVTFSEGLTSIGKWAFAGCTAITSITIPSSVKLINDYTFLNCTGLTSVFFSQGLDSIGVQAFYCCDNLASIHIPEGVTSIGAGAFAACKQLASVTLPSSVTSIAVSAFSGSCILSQFVVSESNPLYATEGLALFTKDKRRLLSFPSGQVKQYIVPSGVESINKYAFYDCISLASIEIPESVTLIGEIAFFECDSLKKIYVRNPNPPAIEDLSTIIVMRYSSCTLYVPIGFKERYATADGWKDFQNIEEIDFASVQTDEKIPFDVLIYDDGITITGAEPGVSITVYTVTGTKLLTLPATGDKQRIALPSGGIYFVKVGNQVKKIAL